MEEFGDGNLAPGVKLDRYELLCPLAQGGMALVWLARIDGLGYDKIVVIKTILPKYAQDVRFQNMFLDEARITTRIHHPNVAGILDVGEHNGTLYMAMEWVDGDSLSRLLNELDLRRARMPVGVALRICADLCAGLHAAHEVRDENGEPLGVVHRDVSPSNLLLCPSGEIKLIDFGVAKARDRYAQDTSAGQLKGKLRYMAPEQLGGEVSPSVDIYATGLLLWEALTGRSPFHDVVEGAHLVASVLGGVSAKPSSCRSEISPALEAIVAKALDLLPARRFANALEMAAALEATGLAASRTGVAAYVQEFASEVLAARSSVVALLERGMPADEHTPPRQVEKTSNEAVMIASAAPAAKRRRALPLGLVAGASLGLAVLAFALRPGAQRLPSPMGATAEPPLTSVSGRPAEARTTPVPSASASVPLSAPPTPTSSSTQSSPPTGRPTAKPKPKPDRPDCSIPYTVDANGYRSYRRECFQQP